MPRQRLNPLDDLACAYLPRTSTFPVDLVVTEAAGNPRYAPDRWRRVARSVTIHRIEASHYGCITRETAVLGRALQACLARRGA